VLSCRAAGLILVVILAGRGLSSELGRAGRGAGCGAGVRSVCGF